MPPSSNPPRPESRETHFQVVVIGAGVVGASVALALARRGIETCVIDRLGEAGHGSTSASCGLVRRFYPTPTMSAMAEESARIWADWGEWLGARSESGLARFERPGMLFIPPVLGDDLRAIVEHMNALGVAAEILDAAQVAARFPFLDMHSQSPVRSPDDDDFFDVSELELQGAVYEPDAGYVISPMLAAKNLREAAEAAGARFTMGNAVTAIEDGGAESRFRLALAGGSVLRAEVVVNVGGPQSGLVNALAGVELPLEIRPLRREVCAVANPLHGKVDAPSLPILGDLDSGIYCRPESGGRDLIVGSLDPACDTMQWVDDPDDFDDILSVEGFQRQVLRLMKRFPEVELGDRRGLAGLYDVTLLDWNPVLDVTDRPGFYVAIGTSGSSFKTAPVIGLLMAALIEACEAGLDHDRDPLQLRLERTGFELDVSFFSRLRAAHKTTGTVLG